MNKPKPAGGPDATVIAQLQRYQCPTPFHAVRTRFMGNIASPVADVSPMNTLKALWDGELPAFDTMDAVNELFNELVAGLWNRLTAHQNSRDPFKLMRFEVPPTPDGLKHLAQVRLQELDGFIEGLFGANEQIDLPERAHEALRVLAEIRAMLAGIAALLGNDSKPAQPGELKGLMHNLQKMTLIAETEMNKTILSCKRARVQSMAQVLATKPTLH